MGYLTAVTGHDAINGCFRVWENVSPRVTAGIKIVAAGLFIAAPCELLLPASLLSPGIRSFFVKNWRIVKTGKTPVSLSGRSSTDRMLEMTHKYNTKGTNIASRWVVSRAMGSLGVAGASLLDTIREIALGVLIGVYAFGTKACELALRGRLINPLNLENASGRDAFIHLRDAAIHAVIVVAAPVLGLIAPSKLLLPVIVKMNFADSKKSCFLHKLAAETHKISTRQLILIGAGFIGLTAIGHTCGALSLLEAVVLPYVPNAVTFPLTRKIIAAISGVSIPQGRVVFEELKLLVNKMDVLSPDQKVVVLQNLKLLTDWFDGLSSSAKGG